MKRIILNGPDFCAVTENGRLVEYIPRTEEDRCGDILLGKIDRIMPGMNCVFVDIRRKKNGFLPLNEASESFCGEKVRSGDMIPIQIKKEEHGDKGAYLTRDIVEFGHYWQEDTNGNRKLLKKRRQEKIDNVAALMDAYIAYKVNKDMFE